MKRQTANGKRQATSGTGSGARAFQALSAYAVVSFVLLFLTFDIFLSLFAFPVAAQNKRRPTPKPAATAPPAQFTKLSQQANAAREADKLDEAVTLYLQALKLNPQWTEGWWYVGSLFYERDRYSEGRDAFKNLVAVDAKFYPGWSMLGLCEFQLKEYQAAVAHLRRGNEAGFGDNEQLRRVARYHEAILLTKFENFELALDVFQRFVDPRSEGPDVLLALGLAGLRLAYLPEEAPPAQRELALKAGRAIHLSLTNRVGDARREYQELVERYANTPGVHYMRGVFLLRDAPDEGITELKREIELSPRHVAARLQLAFEYIKRADYAAGLPYAEQAVELAPDLFATHNALGRILIETGEVERAIKELERGTQLAPDSPEMYFALARAYSRAGRPQDAAKARTEFTRLDKLRRAKREGTAYEANPETKPQI